MFDNDVINTVFRAKKKNSYTLLGTTIHVIPVVLLLIVHAMI